MPSKLPLRCPACGSREATHDGHGVYTCTYCGQRYIEAADGSTVDAPPVVPEVKAAGRGTIIAVALAVVAALTGGVLQFIAYRTEPDTLRPEVVVAPATRADISPGFDDRGVPEPVGVSLGPPPVEAVAPATAEVQLHHVKTTVTGSQYVYGKVTNTSPFTIDKPEIYAILKDANGAEVGNENGFAERDVLGPGQSSPFQVLLMKPPSYASLALQVTADRASWIPTYAEGLELEATAPEHAPFGDGLIFSGLVHNRGDSAARFVKVLIVGLDSEDRITGMGYTYAGGDRFEPGTSARYRTTGIDFAVEPARFDVTVTGRVVD